MASPSPDHVRSQRLLVTSTAQKCELGDRWCPSSCRTSRAYAIISLCWQHDTSVRFLLRHLQHDTSVLFLRCSLHVTSVLFLFFFLHVTSVLSCRLPRHVTSVRLSWFVGPPLAARHERARLCCFANRFLALNTRNHERRRTDTYDAKSRNQKDNRTPRKVIGRQKLK